MKNSKIFYAQFNEDRILFELFGKKTNGICVEIGANDGVNDSNSYFFEKIGWTCILVEPNPILCQSILAIRNSRLFECAASSVNGKATLYIAEGSERSHGVSTLSNNHQLANEKIKSYGFTSRPVEVETRTLDDILTETRIVAPIDFVSIDVEGHELAVLDGFSLDKWKPRIVLLEDNSYFKEKIECDYMNSKGYERFMRTGVNDWYASREDKELVNIKAKIKLFWIICKTRVIHSLRNISFVVKILVFLKKIRKKMF